MCDLLENNGISAILDLSYSGYEQKRFLSGLDNVPYFQLEYTIQPFVHIMTTYIQARMGNDVVFIFQNEIGRNEGFSMIRLKYLIFCFRIR